MTLQNPVRPDGTYDERVPDFQGKMVFEHNPEIVEALRERGRLFRAEEYEHAYPHCWRCGTPLLYYAKSSWYVATSERPRPDARGQRGHRLAPRAHQARPLRQVAGGKRRLGAVAGALLGHAAADLGVHRLRGALVRRLDRRAARARRRGTRRPAPSVHRRRRGRAASSAAGRCAGWSRRSTPGSTRARCRSPSSITRSRTAEEFESRFPADYICEGLDQTRGWFYSLLAVATQVFGRGSYEHCVCLGLIADPEGQKMSKSRGNVVDPWEVLDRHGADAFRWYYLSSQQPWAGYRFSAETVGEAVRQFMLTLWNTYSFFVLYANAEGLGPDDFADAALGEADARSLGALAAAGADPLGDRAHGRLRLHDRGPGDRRLRRRALQLVRAAQPPPLLGRRPGRVRHPAPLPDRGRRSCSPRSPRSSPTRSTPTSPATATRSTWPTSPSPTRSSRTASSRPGSRRRCARSSSAARRAPRRRSRTASRCGGR